MALPLYIPPCIRTPPGPFHPPAHEIPLRVQIEGPLVAIRRLIPHVPWELDKLTATFPQSGGCELAKLALHAIYGSGSGSIGGFVVLDEYLGWAGEPPYKGIDYYGVTFDHLVPVDDANPEVLQINIIEIEDDGGVFANEHMPFAVEPAEFMGKKVLAVPRCCQKRKGTQDRGRVNDGVEERDQRMRESN